MNSTPEKPSASEPLKQRAQQLRESLVGLKRDINWAANVNLEVLEENRMRSISQLPAELVMYLIAKGTGGRRRGV